MLSLTKTTLVAMALSLAARSQTFRDDVPDAPTTDTFIRRGYHASIAIGDYVYIDGGEISQMIDGEKITKKINYTLSIDMSESWTNDSVTMQLKDRNGAPALNRQLLWPNSDNKSFFAFGGEESWLDSPWLPPTTQLWQMTTDGNGAGTWNQFFFDTSSQGLTITRPTEALGGVVDNTGFIIGGYRNSHSFVENDYYQGVNREVPGIASFNITSGTWSNDTAPDYLIRQNGTFGILHPIPNFGPVGLLMITGTTVTDGVADPFENITLYEPISKKWYTQKATGDVPVGRDKPCTVGVKGDNGTYEIFVYSGNLNPYHSGNMTAQLVSEYAALDEVYVLSLPAFVWFKANYTARASRNRHTCEVVGNRQMLTIGGYTAEQDANLGSYANDTFLQGLAIFDLTEMQWNDKYDAGAAPYQTPEVVKAWYRENGSSPESWNNPDVRTFFEKASTTDAGSSSGTTSQSPNPTPSGYRATSHTGAIAGGVVGGIAAIALIAGLIFWLLRRKHKRNNPRSGYSAPGEQSRGSRLELPIREEKPETQELHEDYRPLEMDGSHPTVELEGQTQTQGRHKSYLQNMNRVPSN